METRTELRRQRDDALARAARATQEANELRDRLVYVTGSFNADEYAHVGRDTDGKG